MQVYSYELSDPVISFLLTVSVSIVVYLLRARVRIVWTITHEFVHHIRAKDILEKMEEIAKAQSQIVPEEQRAGVKDNWYWAATLMVMNRGRAVASDLEITLNWKPLGVSVWPQRSYSEAINPSGRFVLSFPSLASGETIVVQMLDLRQLPVVTSVRSTTTVGKEVRSQPQILYPRWLLMSVIFLMILGAALLTWAAIYIALLALRSFGMI